jgi:hypothetical protein
MKIQEDEEAAFVDGKPWLGLGREHFCFSFLFLFSFFENKDRVLLPLRLELTVTKLYFNCQDL